tara:strand:+ start:5521 stop:6036 length:516 start_codon:yes stop_codon:yes gene_type:complete
MKNIVKITRDYDSNLSDHLYNEDLNCLVNELNVFCEVGNNDFFNIVEKEKNYQSERSEYKNKISIKAIGYSQSEWQKFTLYYNESELKTPKQRMYFSSLVQSLERLFTYRSDYLAELYQQTEINGKKFNSDIQETYCFCVNDVEFPTDANIIENYISSNGNDFDSYTIEKN